MSLTVASFYVKRREEHPKAADYPAMLTVLQRSCERIGFRHVVLTDHETVESGLWPLGVEAWIAPLPSPLMQACTEAQARYLECRPDGDILFVGADSILLTDPRPHLPADADLCVTARKPSVLLDAINNGFQFIRREAAEKAAPLYRRVAARCGETWRDDQKALVAELAPVPLVPGLHDRAGLRVGFLPMRRFNDCPRWPGDPCKEAILLHFRGRQRKRLMFEWAKKRGFS